MAHGAVQKVGLSATARGVHAEALLNLEDAERKAVRIAPLGANGCDVNTLRCATNFIDDESWKSFTFAQVSAPKAPKR